jgi:hypothetical protein
MRVYFIETEIFSVPDELQILSSLTQCMFGNNQCSWKLIINSIFEGQPVDQHEWPSTLFRVHKSLITKCLLHTLNKFNLQDIFIIQCNSIITWLSRDTFCYVCLWQLAIHHTDKCKPKPSKPFYPSLSERSQSVYSSSTLSIRGDVNFLQLHLPNPLLRDSKSPRCHSLSLIRWSLYYCCLALAFLCCLLTGRNSSDGVMGLKSSHAPMQ